MSAASPLQAAPATRRRWRWARRALAFLGSAVLLLVIFHRPLGHWAIRHFGGGALTKAGITGGWKTSGSLLTGITVDDLRLTGDAGSQVRLITLQHAEVDYDLGALRRTGPGTLLKRLVVQNVEAEIDLTRPRPPRPVKPPGVKSKPVLPSVVLPEVRIENLTLRIQLPNGPLLIRRFSLVVDPARPGLIEVEELDLPGTPVMHQVKGITRLTPTTLTLENVALYPDTILERLMVDLANLPADEATFALAGRQGETRVVMDGKSGNWFTGVTADLAMTVRNISQETLAFWGVPAGSATWQADQVVLKVNGPVLRPDRIAMDLSIDGGRMTLPQIGLAPVRAEAAVKDGKFTLTRLEAAAGSNTASVRGEATLPESWARIARVPGWLDVTCAAPVLTDLLPPGTEVSGAAEGKGRISFADMALTEITAEAKAAGLRIKGVPVESAASRVRLAGGVLRLEEGRVRLNEGNGLKAAGQLNLKGERDLLVNWRADAGDLSTVPAEGRPGLIWPTAGRLVSQGTASGSLAQWQAGDWKSLSGEAGVEASGLRMRDAALDRLQLRARATAGVIAVDQGVVRLDAVNTLTFNGGADLTDPVLPVQAKIVLEMPDLTKASAWSTQFRGPALLGGAVAVDWQGRGRAKPWQMDGGGRASVKGLKLAGVPELLGLKAEVVQSGSSISVTDLNLSAGPWRAGGAVHYDGWHLTIPGLQAFAKNERLVDLSGRLPWRGAGVPPDSPVSLRLKVERLDAAKLAAALGRPFPVQGRLNAAGDFGGTLEKLSGRLVAEAEGIRPADPAGFKAEPATVRLTALLKDGKLALNGTAIQRPLQPLTLAAGLPLDLPALLADPKSATALPLSAEVKLPASSLAFLPAWVPALRSVEGTAAANFTVTGTVGKPVWKGGATVTAAQASFDSSSLPTVKEVKLRVRADERRFTVDEASVMLAGGRLRVTGGAALDNVMDPALDFKLAADEVLVVRDDNLSLRANAGITCTGRWSQALVKGQVDLVRGRVFKEIEFLPLSLPDDLPPPPPPTTLGRQGAPALPAPFDRWNFDIAIKTRDPVRLMGNVARGNAVADLRFSGPGTKPDLTGTVKLEEMWLKLPFSRLNVTEGVVTFNREQPFDPQINITGESITGSRIVQVFVQGRALDPKVRLTSSPPLPEGEIASLLATGVTTSDLTSSSDEAAGRAAFVLLKQTYRKLFRKAAVNSDDDEPPRLSFDFSVFGSDPARRGISAVYELNPQWRVIGRVGETGTFRGLLHYLIRFR